MRFNWGTRSAIDASWPVKTAVAARSTRQARRVFYLIACYLCCFNRRLDRVIHGAIHDHDVRSFIALAITSIVLRWRTRSRHRCDGSSCFEISNRNESELESREQQVRTSRRKLEAFRAFQEKIVVSGENFAAKQGRLKRDCFIRSSQRVDSVSKLDEYNLSGCRYFSWNAGIGYRNGKRVVRESRGMNR